MILTNPPELVELDRIPSSADFLRHAGEIVVNVRDVVDESGLRWGRVYGLAPSSGPVYPVEPHRRPEAFVVELRGRPSARVRSYREAVAWVA